MTITMKNNSQKLTFNEIKLFLDGSAIFEFKRMNGFRN